MSWIERTRVSGEMAHQASAELGVCVLQTENDHTSQFVSAVIAVMRSVRALLSERKPGTIWTQRFVKRFAHLVQIDERDRIFPRDCAHCLWVIAQGVDDVACVIEVPTLRRGDQDRSCTTSACFGDIGAQITAIR